MKNNHNDGQRWGKHACSEDEGREWAGASGGGEHHRVEQPKPQCPREHKGKETKNDNATHGQ